MWVCVCVCDCVRPRVCFRVHLSVCLPVRACLFACLYVGACMLIAWVGLMLVPLCIRVGMALPSYMAVCVSNVCVCVCVCLFVDVD